MDRLQFILNFLKRAEAEDPEVLTHEMLAIAIRSEIETVSRRNAGALSGIDTYMIQTTAIAA